MMSVAPFQRRLEALRKILSEQPFDTILISEPYNRAYMSGFWAEDMHPAESSGFLLINDQDQVLATDFRYQEQAAKEAPGFRLVVYKETLLHVLADILASLDTKNLGFESRHLTHDKFMQVEETLHKWNPRGKLIASKDLVEGIRVVKEPAELQAIRESLDLTERVFDAVLTEIEIGKTEREVAWRIEELVREGGAEAVAFPPIVASGQNAAMPHAIPTDRRLQRGETIIVDMGARVAHYCSDMTRTIILGEADSQTRQIYATVRQAQLAAMDAIRAGISSLEVDKVARDYIDSAGYGDYFGHGLGHGVGLAVHEKPGFGKLSAMVLEENMVVTVEPGIYLPGCAGVRLENMVRVTRQGCELLNKNDFFYSF
ncbi:MAG: aminopeptidase P family protein [Deltaproteobacteria bacterium]|nr:aminopeptidase P family protein [Deltaproteobacteria bacterium]MBW2072587.1 aminopeptidase P family protein [Deltaproteobacteria bacterium]